MNTTPLPGTTILLSPNDAFDFFQRLFADGDIMLSQVLSMTGLSTHDVQNWIKRKFVESPAKKKYSREHFSKIIIINMLSPVMNIETISKLLDYLHKAGAGAHFTYMTFLKVFSIVSHKKTLHGLGMERVVKAETEKLNLSPQLRLRLFEVLRIMILLYESTKYRSDAFALMHNLVI